MSSAAHPQTDGQTERANRVVEEILRSYLGFDQSEMWQLLPEVEFAINDSPLRSAGGMSPFEIVTGQSPLRPADVVSGVDDATLPTEPQERAEGLSARRTTARELLRKAAAAMVEQANRRRRPLDAALKPGAQVYVKRSHLLTPAQRAQLRDSGRAKLQEKYNGPYRVIRRIGNVAFEIDLPASSRAHRVIHADALKMYQPHGISGLAPAEAVELYEDTAAGQQPLYMVDRLLKSRRRRQRTQYLVKWQHYPVAEATWVTYANLGSHWQQHIPAAFHQPTATDKAAAAANPITVAALRRLRGDTTATTCC